MATLAKKFSSKTELATRADWDFAFWFAVLSPVLGILTGFVALFLFYR